MDQFYIRSNTSRIKQNEVAIAQIESGIIPGVSADVDLNNHNLTEVATVQFDASGSTPLTANADGHLLWNGSTVHTGGADQSGVLNPMADDLDASTWAINEIGEAAFHSHNTSRDFSAGTIKRDTVGSNDFMKIQGNNLALSAGSGTTSAMSALVEPTSFKLLQSIHKATYPERGPLAITSRTSGSDYGYLDVTGSGSSTQLMFNGVALSQSDQPSGNHSLTNVKQVGFDTDIQLTTNQEPSSVQLMFGDHQVGTYQPASSGSINMQRVGYGGAPEAYPVTSIPDATMYPVSLAPVQYTAPEGKYTYDVKVTLILDQGDLPEGTSFNWDGIQNLYLYCSATNLYSAQDSWASSSDNPSIELPSDSLMICKAIFHEVSESTSNKTAHCAFTIESEAGSSDNGYVSYYGWNPSRCSGKDYLYFVVTGSYTDAQGGTDTYQVTNFGCAITRAFKQHSVALTNGNQVSSLTVDTTGDLVLGTKTVSTHLKSSLTTTDTSEQTLALYKVKNNTGGLLQAYVYNEKAAYKIDAHVVNKDGVATVSGSSVEELSNTDGQVITMTASGSNVKINVQGEINPLNWGSHWNYHNIPIYVPQGYAETLFFPFTEDLDDDIIPVSPNSVTSGSWYQFNDNSLEFQSMSSGAHYNTTGADMDLNTDFSMSFWVNIPASTNPYNALILSNTQPSDNNNSGWRFMTYSNNLDWSIHLNSGKILYKRLSYNALKGAGWKHMVYTYNGTSDASVGNSLEAWWDTVNQGLGAVAGGSMSKASPIGFPGGNFSLTAKNSSHAFDGWKISHLRFWNRVITTEEITKLASERA